MKETPRVYFLGEQSLEATRKTPVWSPGNSKQRRGHGTKEAQTGADWVLRASGRPGHGSALRDWDSRAVAPPGGCTAPLSYTSCEFQNNLGMHKSAVSNCDLKPLLTRPGLWVASIEGQDYIIAFCPSQAFATLIRAGLLRLERDVAHGPRWSLGA